MKLDLLLTRSESQNRAMLSLIESTFSASDINAISMPLLEASELLLDQKTKDLILDLDRFDQIIFISKNAVAFGMERLTDFWVDWPISLKWLAVGSATAESLAAWDVKADWPEQASSEGLLATPNLQSGVVSGQRILIVRGVGGRETLRLTLANRGAEVSYLEAYKRSRVDYDSAFVQRIPAAAICLVYSGEAMEYLHHLLTYRERNEQPSSVITLVVPSERLLSKAKLMGFASVVAAKDQSNRAMLDELQLMSHQG